MLLAVLTSSDPSPLVVVYAAASGCILAASVWITVAVANAEDPVGRWILLANTRRSSDVVIATAVSAVLYEVLLCPVGLVYPLATGHHKVTVSGLLIGTVAELTCALVGTGVGLLCARPVIMRTGVSTLAGIALILAVLLVKQLPPVSPMLRRMTDGSSDHTTLTGVLPFAGFAVLGAAALCSCGALAHRLGHRRD
ncbi:hypothetical protein ACFQ9X_54270 [Catenulispora yoronensis]